jgi:hypothetical protein
MPAELFIVRYFTESGTVHHWALYLETSSGKRRIYQVVGQPTAFEYAHRKDVRPQNSRSEELVFVSEVDNRDVKAVKKVLKRFPIRNDSATWNPQDWVFQALDEMEDWGLIDEVTYFEAREYLFPPNN